MIGIISAMEVEYRHLLESLEKDGEETLYGRVYHLGKIGGKKVVIGSCGVGKSNAAIGTQIMIDYFKIKKLIHSGIAGSLSNNADYLSLVIAERVSYHDVSLNQMKRLYPFQEYFYSDKRLLELANELSDKIDISTNFGLIVSGDTFINSEEKRARILNRHPALAVDMESCAVAHSAFISGVPFIVIRSISDMANEESDEKYKDLEEQAANQTVDFVRELIKLI